MRLIVTLAFGLLVCAPATPGQQQFPGTDRIRLAEAFKIGESIGDQLWRHWDKAPFSVLLITPDTEFLIRHPQPPDDFIKYGYDTVLNSQIYSRKRTQNLSLLATFPFAGVPTIVIGQAENTAAKTSTRWVITLLHEHFHQLQYSQPDYYSSVSGLDLARGDETGMWMLTYPFPYGDAKVKEQFAAMSRMLARTLELDQSADVAGRVAAYLEMRRRFETMLKAEDYRYFSFQVWQEGISRYTEYRTAELAAAQHTPSKEFSGLSDFQPFGVVADGIFNNIVRQLSTLEFDKSKREAFYPFGAGEGLLLDRIAPDWRKRYFAEPFFVDRYFHHSK